MMRAAIVPEMEMMPPDPLPDQMAGKIAAACRAMERDAPAPSLRALAGAAGMSAYYFHRCFKAATGLTPKAYANAVRRARMRAALAEAGSVTEAIYAAGFNSSGRFYDAAVPDLGMTPGAFRAQGAGERIRFAVGQCRLGAILVASSARGVCAIALGDDPELLVRGLQDQFPAAVLLGGDAAFEGMMARVVGFVEAPGAGLELPLDIRGTAFQHRVWQALRKIPAGQTVSYQALAALIGAPKSARAVASACAANRLAVAIPCHRVVRRDGALSGYRWGVERKRALLAREAVDAG
jgi:AraC family transcriptional regulator of adaptative response/methylated-DNA-[protein]-cysteine methyltransferase